MKVSDHMRPEMRYGKGSIKHRVHYRAARRNIAKINYRQTKRARKP